MKNVVGTAVAGGLMTVVLALGATAQVGNHDQNSGFGQADAATMGVESVNATNGWCAADAGSLGHPDPVAACK